MWYFDPKLEHNKFHVTSFCALFVLLASLISASFPFVYATSNPPYDSGYNHGCNDARIADPSNRYINQPGKEPSFHTDLFMQGYYDGNNACISKIETIPGIETETFKINATIDFDRQTILEENGKNLGDAWFTINGQRYNPGTYYDMIDWVYDDDVEALGINTDSLNKILELPLSLEAGQRINVCLNDDKGYQACKTIINSEEMGQEKVSFIYP